MLDDDIHVQILATYDEILARKTAGQIDDFIYHQQEPDEDAPQA